MTTVTFFGSDKGGVGKSEMALLLARAYTVMQRPVRLIDIDHQMKMSNVMGKQVSVSMGATVTGSDLHGNDNKMREMFNPLYDHWSASDCLMDLGANVTTPFLDWFSYNDVASLAARDNIKFRAVFVTTADKQAIESVSRNLRQAAEVFKGCDAEFFVVFNDIVGSLGFRPYKGIQGLAPLHGLMKDVGALKLRVPNCKSKFFDFARVEQRSIVDIYHDADNVGAANKLSRIVINNEKLELAKWLSHMQAEVRPLLTFDSGKVA